MNYDVSKAFLSNQAYNTDNMKEGDVVTDPKLNDWRLILKSNPNSNGYQGSLFKSMSTKEYVFVSRGTEEARDALADAKMLIGIPDQMVSQRNFFNEAKDEIIRNQGNPGTDLSATGHSLGGSLVNLLGAENPSLKVAAFNAYGVGNLVPKGDYSNITNNVMAGDLISATLRSVMIGKTYMYNNGKSLAHSVANWLDASLFNQAGTLVNLNEHGGIQGDPFTGMPWAGDEALIAAVQAQFKTALTVAIDPLVLDLDGDGDGVETTTLSKTTIGGVNFNLDAKGLAEKTGWVGKDDGLLVRDLDGDGQITSGRELFGNHALLQSGKAAAHGFEALKELDSNADGVVDAKDNAFGTLRVWKDADSDGVTDAGELLTLDAAGVKSLKVGYSNANTIDAQGNAHRQLGSFTTTAGATRAMNDVWFGVDTARTVDQDVVAVSANIAALPELAGNDAHWRLAA